MKTTSLNLSLTLIRLGFLKVGFPGGKGVKLIPRPGLVLKIIVYICMNFCISNGITRLVIIKTVGHEGSC